MHVCKQLLLTTLSAIALSASANWLVPEDLTGKVQTLSDAHQQFIESGTAIKVIPEQQLIHALKTREPDALATMLDDLMGAAVEMGYLDTRDMGAAPLNLTTDEYRRLIVTPAELRKPKRDDGPFSTSRYLFPQSGVPTFGGARVAIWPEDLTAGDVDVAITGVTSNLSSGVRDASWAPDQIRALNVLTTPDSRSLIKPFEALTVVDYGNFGVDNMSAELSVPHLTEMIAETAATSTIPFLVGGDTSILFSAAKGLAQHHGAQTFGYLHLSAHPDSEQQDDHTISDKSFMFQVLSQALVGSTDTVLVGLRGQSLNPSNLQWLSEQGVRYHTMADIRRRGIDTVIQQLRRDLRRGPDRWFVSIDASVLAPSDMVAAGRIEANGLAINEVTEALRYACAETDLIGFAITDVAPMMDLSRLSLLHASSAINACLSGMALNKLHIDPEYVHPLARTRGR